MQSLLDPSKGFKVTGLQGEAFTVSIGRVFAFAYVWALGGNLAPAARPGFDEHVREQLQDVVNIPGRGTPRSQLRLAPAWRVTRSEAFASCCNRLICPL